MAKSQHRPTLASPPLPLSQQAVNWLIVWARWDAALQAMCALSQIYSDIERVANGALVYKISVSEGA